MDTKSDTNGHEAENPRFDGLRGFTLMELLVTVAIVGILAAILLPVLSSAKESARKAECAGGLRQLGEAAKMYLTDWDGHFFPYRYSQPGEGMYWWFGHEPRFGQGDAEGERYLDKTRSFFYPYLRDVASIEICPSFPFWRSDYKPKFTTPSWGYAYNSQGLAGENEAQVRRPSKTVLMCDGAQINDFQPPAGPDNPMIEEFYYVSLKPFRATVHFRHGERANVLFCDGRIESMSPYPGTLDPRVDGLVGMLAPKGDYGLFDYP